MKIKEIFNSRLAKLIGVDAITLYPFIFYAGIPTDIVRRHEWEHVAQVRRLGWFRFYASYLWEYLGYRLISRWSHLDAYANISFELEAHVAQSDGQRPWEA